MAVEVLKEPEACGWGLEDTGTPSATSQAAVETTGVGSIEDPRARQVLLLLS